MLATPVPQSIATGRLTLSRERRGPGTIVSLVIHGAIVAVFLWQSAVYLGEGGGGPGARGGGGGRGHMRAQFFTVPAYAAPQPQVDMPIPTAYAIPVMTTPVIPIDLARIEVPRPQTTGPTGPATGVGPGTGGGQGSGQGPGIGNAVGPGTGGDAGYIPASPRWLILTPTDPPATVKGHKLRVQFWVTADGHVTRVETQPQIADAGYRRNFMERMMGYLFNPATTRDGQPVASVFTITVTP